MRKIKYLLFVMSLVMIGVLNVKALDITGDYTFTEDYVGEVSIDGVKAVIDLNGHTVTNTGDVFVATNGADITITGNGTIVSTGDSGISLYSGSKATLENGTINVQEFGVFVTGQTTFIMNGGTINTIDNVGIGGNGRNTDNYKDYTVIMNGGTINANIESEGYSSCGIYHPSEGTVTINGGTINSSNGAGIVQRGGVLNINGGTINTSEDTEGFLGKVGDSRQVVPSAAVVVDKKSIYPAYQTIETNINSNAVMNGVAGNIEKIGDEIVINVTGGIYNEEPDESLLAEGYSAYAIVEGEYKDSYIVAKENDFDSVISDGIISEDGVSAEDKALVADLLSKYSLAAYYDVQLLTVLKSNDAVIVDNIKETSTPVKVSLGIPTNLPALKDGFKREFYVIRIHNGQVTLIKDVTVKDSSAEFESGEFSTYVLVYNDVEQAKATSVANTTATTEETATNPKTLDKIVIYLVGLGISFVGMAKIINAKKDLKA